MVGIRPWHWYTLSAILLIVLVYFIVDRTRIHREEVHELPEVAIEYGDPNAPIDPNEPKFPDGSTQLRAARSELIERSKAKDSDGVYFIHEDGLGCPEGWTLIDNAFEWQKRQLKGCMVVRGPEPKIGENFQIFADVIRRDEQLKTQLMINPNKLKDLDKYVKRNTTKS